MNETLQIIKSRRSTRAFLPEQIKEEELQAVLEAGIYAPSATNQQPWHFTVIQRQELIDDLSRDFKELAANSDHPYLQTVGKNEKFHVFYQAPTVILISGDESKFGAIVDCAAATQNILIAAESLGLGSCWIGFIAYLLNNPQGKDYLKELGIPAGFRQHHAVALGYKRLRLAAAPSRKPNTVNYIR